MIKKFNRNYNIRVTYNSLTIRISQKCIDIKLKIYRCKKKFQKI